MPSGGDMFRIRPLAVEKSQAKGPAPSPMPKGPRSKKENIKRPPRSGGKGRSPKGSNYRR